MKPSSSNDLDYYAILGVARDASTLEIKQTYRALVKRFHPDLYALNPDIAWEAEIRMSEINRAHEVLSDIQKRQQYDEECLKKAAYWTSRGHQSTSQPTGNANDDMAGVGFRALVERAFRSAQHWLSDQRAASTQSRFMGIPGKIILAPTPFSTAIVVSSMLWQLGTVTGFQVPGVISAVLAYPIIVISLVVRLMLPIRYSPMISRRKKLALTPLILASALLLGWFWLMVIDQHGTVGNPLDIYWWCGLITLTSLIVAFL